MPNPLILAGLVGAGFYFLNKSKSKTSSKISQPSQDSGIIITNCSSIKIIDIEKFSWFFMKTFNDTIKSKQIYDLDYTDFDTIDLTIKTIFKKIAPGCYDLFIKKNYKTKEQLITVAVLFIFIWNEYVGQFFANGKWKSNFATQIDFEIWANKIITKFDDQFKADITKFGITIEDILNKASNLLGEKIQGSESPKLQINDITEETFQKLVIEGSIDENVLVDFYADWCIPCKQLSEMLSTLPFEFIEKGKTRFYKLNIDLNPNLKGLYKVEAIPYLVIFKNGLVIGTFKGLPNNKDILMSWIINPTIAP